MSFTDNELCGQFSICLFVGFAAKTEGPLKCHICDQDTCKTFDRKAQPQVCPFLA